MAFPTVCQAYSLILRKVNAEHARGWSEELRRHAPLLNPTREDYTRAQRQAFSYSGEKLSLFDTVTACPSERLGLLVWTYDPHFDVIRVDVWRRQASQ